MEKKLHSVFEPVQYAFRTFYKHIKILFLYVLLLSVAHIIMSAIVVAIGWPMFFQFKNLMMHQQQENIMGMMPPLNFMKNLALTFYFRLGAIIAILIIYTAWMWAAVCKLALDIHDKGFSSLKNIALSIRAVPKIISTHSILLAILGIPLFLLMNIGLIAGPFRFLTMMLFIFFAALIYFIFLFSSYFFVDKNAGVINALRNSYQLTTSGGGQLCCAMLLVVLVPIPIHFLPLVGKYIGLLLTSLGLVYLYRKFSVNS